MPQIATLLLLIPIQTLGAKSFKTYQKRLRKAADARLAHVSEIISAIRLVKFEAWEAGLGAKMGELRDVELQQLWAKSLTTVFDLVMMSGVPVVVSVSGVGFGVRWRAETDLLVGCRL